MSFIIVLQAKQVIIGKKDHLWMMPNHNQIGRSHQLKEVCIETKKEGKEEIVAYLEAKSEQLNGWDSVTTVKKFICINWTLFFLLKITIVCQFKRGTLQAKTK